MNKWISYNLIIGFAVYWLSNLMLWFPWSINPILGMTLMLTVSPVIWVIASYACLVTYPGKRLLKAALINGSLFLLLAVLMDYVFFGLIRNAMNELYHSTTLYGYAFVMSLPFITVFGFRNRIKQNLRTLNNSDFIKPSLTGLFCFALLILIILLEIKIR